MRRSVVANLPLATVAMAMTINFVSYLDRVCMSVAGPFIRKEFGFTATQLGWVFGIFSLSYALMQAPWGMLADRLDGRKIVAPAMLGWSAFTALTATTYSLPSLIGVRFTFGALEAGLAPAMAAIFRETVPARSRSTAFGLFLSGGRLGGAFAPALTAAIVLWQGWRAPFFIFAGVGVAATLAWSLIVRPANHYPVRKSSAATWRELVTWPVAALLLTAFGYTLMWQFYATWFPTYLVERFDYSVSQAATYASLPFLFGMAGNWAGGYLIDRISISLGAHVGRTLAGCTALFASGAVFAIGAHDSSPIRSVWELSAAAGLGDIFLSAAWTSATELGKESAAALSGHMNTASNLGGMLSPILLGWARQQPGGWRFALLLAALAPLLSAAIWPSVNRRRKLDKIRES
jgi:ACS family glucarate transporter-like MFS transporter